MLRGLLAFMVLVAVALAGTELRRWLRSRGRESLGVENILFVILGVILGNGGLHLFPAELLVSLRPVVLLAVTWIGLLVGIQLDFRILGRLQPWQRRVGVAAPLATGLALALVMLAWGAPVRLCALLGALGMVCSPRPLLQLSRSAPPADRTAMRLLKLIMSLSGVPAVVFLGLADTLTTLGDLPAAHILAGPERLAVSLGLAAVLGYAGIAFLTGERQPVHILALLVGVTALIAGFGAALGGEPMLMALVSGSVIMNRSRFPHRILRAAHSLELPMLVALLVLLGAWWAPTAFLWRAAFVLFVVRGAALLVAGRTTVWLARRRGAVIERPDLGLGLLPQGPLALAILVAAAVTGSVGRGFAEAAFAAFLANHIVGWIWTRRALFPGAGHRTGEAPR